MSFGCTLPLKLLVLFILLSSSSSNEFNSEKSVPPYSGDHINIHIVTHTHDGIFHICIHYITNHDINKNRYRMVSNC